LQLLSEGVDEAGLHVSHWQVSVDGDIHGIGKSKRGLRQMRKESEGFTVPKRRRIEDL
jgi:hypothetical protein